MTEEEGKKEFRVADRRRIQAETGELRKEEAVAAKAERPPSEPARPETSQSVPEMSFSVFVIGLGTQAMMSLGLIPDPESGRSAVDLGAARHLIDVLGILTEKTRGNLDKQEQDLLNHLLFDLRTRFVEEAQKK
jgi:hypothetical protein